MSKVEVQQTPLCDAMYPFVTKPNTKFNPEGKYKITLLLDPVAEEHKAFLMHLHGLLQEAIKTTKKQLNNKPAKRHLRPEDKADSGLYEVTFTSQFPPRVFDAHGHPITGNMNIGNGSKVRVAYKCVPYEGLGGGIKLYLQAVQVVELVEYAGGEASDFGFTEEEGFDVQAKYKEAMGEQEKDEWPENLNDPGDQHENKEPLEGLPNSVPADAMDHMQQSHANDVPDDEIPF